MAPPDVGGPPAAPPEQQPPRQPAEPLPKPGALQVLDFRSDALKKEVKLRPKTQPVKLLQWNIERGYKLAQIIEELKTLDADVLALQEIDIFCERSEWEDTGVAIAKALGLQYVFLCEFEELWSPLRDKDAQGGGVHGNAILSKFDLVDASVVEHTHHPIDWEAPDHPLCKKEPRHGKRLTLAATAVTNQGALLVYSAHLEIFCGMLSRMRQYADIVAHAKAVDASGKGPRHQAILGDLNTQANSLARLSPNYCRDHMRWWSLGLYEAEVWDRQLFRYKHPREAGQANPWLLRQGLDEKTAQALVNPGFSDPWNPRTDVTIDLIKYRWLGFRLMTGKLDWVLLRNCKVLNKAMGNDLYDKSDHKWLLVDVMLLE